MAADLLAAADKYALDRLKVCCLVLLFSIHICKLLTTSNYPKGDVRRSALQQPHRGERVRDPHSR